MYKCVRMALVAVLLTVQGALAQNLARGDEAFDFTLMNLDGEQVSLSDFRGRVVLLNFFGYS